MMDHKQETKCAYCGEALGPNPVRKGRKAYCCEACAYEAERSQDCSGRTDATTSASIVEPASRKK